jgi:hypothetical protein
VPLAPEAIHVSLRQNRPQPRSQTAAAVEVPEERLAFARTLAQTEEVGVHRVSQVASSPGRVERRSRPIEKRPLFDNEMIPGCRVSGGACAREGKILDVQPAKIPVEVSRRWMLPLERMP